MMLRFSNSLLSGRPLRVLMLTAAVSGFGTLAVHAQDQSGTTSRLTLAEFVKERGGTARINLSAKLRMLSQRIAAEACIYAAHANDEAAVAGLTAAIEEFSKIVRGLEVGDDSLGILGPEDSAKILKGLKVLSEEWAPMEAAVKDLLSAGGDNSADVAKIYEQSPKVLKIAQKLSTEVGSIYTDPQSLSVSAAMAIDIAGRQRMLLQKMTKEACQISTEAGSAETLELLATTVSTFDATLTAMIDGMPEAGMPPPPTPEIRADLELVRSNWQTFRAPLDAVLAGTPLDAAGLSQLLVNGDTMLMELADIVAEYAKSATY
jgi:hypothetical protein